MYLLNNFIWIRYNLYWNSTESQKSVAKKSFSKFEREVAFSSWFRFYSVILNLLTLSHHHKVNILTLTLTPLYSNSCLGYIFFIEVVIFVIEVVQIGQTTFHSKYLNQKLHMNLNDEVLQKNLLFEVSSRGMFGLSESFEPFICLSCWI